jgi:hypothetical protein
MCLGYIEFKMIEDIGKITLAISWIEIQLLYCHLLNFSRDFYRGATVYYVLCTGKIPTMKISKFVNWFSEGNLGMKNGQHLQTGGRKNQSLQGSNPGG